MLNQFDQYVLKYQDMVYNIAWHMTRNQHDAEDIAQETFVRAFQHAAEFPSGEPPRAWLCTITLNLCRDWLRRQKPVVPAEENDYRQASGGQDCQVEERAAVKEALMALDPESRLLVVLFHLEGFSHKEISEMTGMPISIIKNRLFRARKKMKEVLMAERLV